MNALRWDGNVFTSAEADQQPILSLFNIFPRVQHRVCGSVSGTTFALPPVQEITTANLVSSLT